MTRLTGTIHVPGDKSISHRALILGALAKGTTQISNLQVGEDVESTKRALKNLGVQIETSGSDVLVHGQGLNSFEAPESPIDCSNSGTTMRLFMGLLAAQNFNSMLIGDESLQARPMNRVATPLRKMGAHINLRDANYAPIEISGSLLGPINYEVPVASAQVKSAIMLAALGCQGFTKLSGLIHSRDHTERMLELFGASISTTNDTIELSGKQMLKPCKFEVPGDPSAAAFWVTAACLLPNSDILIPNVSLNPTRTGFIDVLREMGANIDIEVTSSEPEPAGKIRTCSSKLSAVSIDEAQVPRLIDEIPILAIAMSQAEGVSQIRGAGELRVKESDRLIAIANNLGAMGVDLELFDDGFRIPGPAKLKAAKIQTDDDHRIAMAFTIAGLLTHKPNNTTLDNSSCVQISYPAFFETLRGALS
ncbi:MAG: 3-phosphoshikimate 1-carboxyvinyltransferase [Deltaproteobacteria bacterium]|nr:3-phosphoshikimate 1-carboxyvinyltransferase [Deltaproteobacteria bacterium]